MEFVCSRKSLLPELEIAARVTIGNYSYYSCVNLIVRDNILIMRSTKKVISFISQIGITQNASGEADLFCADLLSIIKGMPSGDIIFKKSGKNIKINHCENHGIKYSLPMVDVYPEAWENLFDVPEGDLLVNLDCAGLFDKVSHAVADADHWRDFFKGTYLSGNEEDLICSASNGSLLSIVERKCCFNIQDVIIPPETTSLLIKYFNSKTLYTNLGKRIYFISDNRTLISSVIDYQYPDPKRVVPKSFDHRVKLKTKDLSDALLRLKIVHSPLHGCVFKFDGNGEVIITTKDEYQLKKGGEIVEIIEGKDTRTEFIVNLDYILGAIQHIEAQEMIIDYKEDEKGNNYGNKIKIIPCPESDYFHLIQCKDSDEQPEQGPNA